MKSWVSAAKVVSNKSAERVMAAHFSGLKRRFTTRPALSKIMFPQILIFASERGKFASPALMFALSRIFYRLKKLGFKFRDVLLKR